MDVMDCLGNLRGAQSWLSVKKRGKACCRVEDEVDSGGSSTSKQLHDFGFSQQTTSI